MARPADRLTVLIDVDNTLLDNDRAKRDLDRALGEALGEAERARFWACYETVRQERGMVNIPLTLAAFDETEPDPARRELLADLVMEFPYREYLYPGALETIAHLRRFARVAVLSDGDAIFQTSKIWRAGLTEAVDGHVLVFDHKEQHLPEIVAAYPSERYALVDDKPHLLQAVGERLPGQVTTVFVRQGHYASAGVPEGEHPTYVVDRIGDVAGLGEADLRGGRAAAAG